MIPREHPEEAVKIKKRVQGLVFWEFHMNYPMFT